MFVRIEFYIYHLFGMFKIHFLEEVLKFKTEQIFKNVILQGLTQQLYIIHILKNLGII